MEPFEIPNIETDGVSIPNIQINGTNVRIIPYTGVRGIGNNYVQDNRVWLITPPQSVPLAVPVTERIGTPIVDMPGCVKVHKENAKNPANKNKMLVDNDPKGNVVLCDNGMPYYQPPDYDARDLTWQTINTEEPEASGVDTGEPPAPDLNTPEPPPTDRPKEEIECPPINGRRIGDLNQDGTERVTGHKLTPDGLICETLWEDVPPLQQYVPSIAVISTTATIATVATASALFAKPLADLLLKVVKPVVKKTIAKVQKMLGKTPPKLSRSDIVRDQYREKKGLPPLKVKKK
jgi:hypothetical protein|tara:strand:- start:686 stop:1558 length:873 start_codon:yes stop_codon:yes gene_type:complete